jgi:sortase (surface protein transpeptidase)
VRALCAATVAVGVSALGLPAAAAADGGLIRLAHLSPDTPSVDVYVGPAAGPGAFVLHGISYGTVSGYRHVPTGTYLVAVRAAGAATSVPPVLAARVQVDGRSTRTVALTGSFAAARLEALPGDPAPPTPGRARLRVITAAATATSLDVSVRGGASVGRRLPFAAASGYVDVAAGATTLEVAADGSAGTALPITLAAGSVYSAVVLDAKGGGLQVRVVLDAAGPGTVPVGGVETGAGGTAAGAGGAAAGGIAVLAVLLLVGRRRPRLVLALVAVTAGTVAVVAPAPAPARPPAAAVQSRSQAPVLAPASSSDRSVPPSRVRIPALGIDSPLARLATDATGALVPPGDFAQAGWFSGGPAPGAVGPAVIAGHVDSVRGPAVFFRLASLHGGDAVLVTRADGTTLRFVVNRIARYPKSAFPTAEVYGPTGDRELRLITCGGRFDHSRRSYVDDVVVFARLD